MFIFALILSCFKENIIIKFEKKKGFKHNNKNNIFILYENLNKMNNK